MPAIAEQVATIEQDLLEALAKVDSLTAERELLAKALTAVTVEKNEIEAKCSDMQALVDETREMVDRLAGMSLTMLRASRRKVATPQSDDGDGELKGDGASSEPEVQTDAAMRPESDFTGQHAGLKRISSSEGMTASERLRANFLLDSAAGPLAMRSPRPRLSDDLPIFLQQPLLGSRAADYRFGGHGRRAKVVE